MTAAATEEPILVDDEGRIDLVQVRSGGSGSTVRLRISLAEQ